MSDIWAIIPVKEFSGAKHRLSGLLSPPERRLLADTMLTDMLDAVSGAPVCDHLPWRPTPPARSMERSEHRRYLRCENHRPKPG